MPKKLPLVGEFGLIDLIRKQVRRRSGLIQGIGDDTAVLSWTKEKFLLFTTDMIIEGGHFTRSTKPYDIGHKAMASNISDIAAMGGTPTFAVVSLGLPSSKTVNFVKEIYRGMEKLCRTFNVAIVGGDTVKSSKVTVNVALLGEVRKKDLVTRSNAKKGDWIFVTGPLGNSLKSGRHLTFTPAVKKSQYLVKNFHPTAMIDVSDGLAADLGHILEESRAGAVLYEQKIPRNKKASLKQALYDGEDFELIFTLNPLEGKRLIKDKHFHFIGEIISKSYRLQLITRDCKRKDVPLKGYSHF